jgi:hypothetical protein
MDALIIGIATAFNFIIIKWKIEKTRYGDAILDISSILTLAYIFGGTLGGMMVAMIASVIISLYLYKYPPNFLGNKNIIKIIKDKYDEIQPR